MEGHQWIHRMPKVILAKIVRGTEKMTNTTPRFFRRILLSTASICLLLSITSPVAGATPEEVTKLLAADGGSSNAFFGYSVSISGDTAVIGAHRHGLSGDSRFGAAYVFVRNPDALPCSETGSADPWCQEAKLLASDAGDKDRFGFWVAIDGDTVVVGARQDDDAGSNSGSAYVFVRSGTTWTEEAKLTASDATAGDRFGTSVAISGDTVVIGAGEADGVGVDSGAAYIFTRAGTIWSEETKLTAADAAEGDSFGHYVAISGDTALMAAQYDDDKGNNSGSAYLFIRNSAAVACAETASIDPWCQQAKITASDGAEGDWFGGRVALSADTALVGAPFGTGIESGTGAAYIFTRSGASWSEQAKLIAADGNAGDTFGFGLALSGDTAIISSDGDSDLYDSAGSAYVFIRSSGVWDEQQPKLVASDGAADEFFSWGIGVSGDTAVIGAPTNPFFNQWTGGPGSAYIFDINRSETTAGEDVVVEPFPEDENGDPIEDAPDISMQFDEVTSGGDTTLTITEDGPPPPNGFELVGFSEGSTYLDIETTATFDGLVEICIDYSGATLPGVPEDLRLLHFEDPNWVDITSSNDFINMLLCGLTSSFSFFGIVTPDPLIRLVADLIDAVGLLNANNGIINSMDSKLEAVKQALIDINDNNDVAAVNVLLAFINAVEAQRGKQISDAEANDLITRAEEIISVLTGTVL